MTLPICKCGHTVFYHSPQPSHHCLVYGASRDSYCPCVGFEVPEVPEALPFVSGVIEANSPAWLPERGPDAAERQRYALLQAAAVIGASQCNSFSRIAMDARRIVEAAEVLLAEIGRRQEGR